MVNSATVDVDSDYITIWDYSYATCDDKGWYWVYTPTDSSSGDYTQKLTVLVDVDSLMFNKYNVSNFSEYYNYEVTISVTGTIGWKSGNFCQTRPNEDYAQPVYYSYIDIDGFTSTFPEGVTQRTRTKNIGSASSCVITGCLRYGTGTLNYGYYALLMEDITATISYSPKCSISNVISNLSYDSRTGLVTANPSYYSSYCTNVDVETYANTIDSVYGGSSINTDGYYPSHKTEYFYSVATATMPFGETVEGRQDEATSITSTCTVLATHTPNCSNIVVSASISSGLSENPNTLIRYRIKEADGSFGSWQSSGTFSGTRGVNYVVESAVFLSGDTLTDANRVASTLTNCSIVDLSWTQNLIVTVDGSQVATDFSIPKPMALNMSARNTCEYSIVYQYREGSDGDWVDLSSNVFTPSSAGVWQLRAIVSGYDLISTVYSCTLLEPTFITSIYSEELGVDNATEVVDGDSLDVFESSVNRVVISHTSSWDGASTGTKTCTVNGELMSSFYVESSIAYSISSEYTIGGVTNTVNFTVLGLLFSNGTVVCGSDELYPGSGVAIDKTAGESLVIIAQGWGSGNNTYEFSAYQTSVNGTNPVALSPDNGVLNGTGLSSTKILIPYSTEYGYKISLKVSSTDDIGRVRGTNGYVMSSSWFTCSVGIVPVVTLLPDPHVGGVNTEFTGDASKSFVRGYDATLTYQWGLYENGTLVNNKLSTTNLTSSNIATLINAVGNYELRCTISGTYSGGTLDSVTVSLPVSIKDIIQTGISDFNRFALVINNSEKSFIITRKRPPYFTELSFEKSLANIGSLSCKLTGVPKELEDVLHKPGAYITLLDRMNPVWIGVITEPNKVNNNMYNKQVSVVQYNIMAYEATKVLALEYIPNNSRGLLAGTITEVAESIIPPKYHGSIGVSSVNYGISLSNTSRLTALDSLYNQAGWRYRCRPNTLEFWEDYTAGNILSGYNDTAMVVHYANGEYTCGFANGFSSNVNGKVTIYDEFLIDFRPSYYQTYDTRDFVINYDAQNVDEIDNIRDKFGTAIVYGVGYSGESIASSMKAWMPINKDYTIDNSMRITKSYDSEIDSVIKLDEITVQGRKYSRYVITMNGWSFPDFSTLPRLKSYADNISIKPRVYFVNSSNKLHYIELDYDEAGPNPPEPNPRRYYDQANNKKTAYTICIDQTDTASDNSTKVTSVVESLVPLSNIIFPVFAVDYPMSLPDVGDEICVGDMVCNVRYKNNTYNEVVVDYKVSADDWQSNGIPHGHYTDVLVMDNSGTYNQSNPHPDSPYFLYSGTSLTTQGPEGYTIMEMERLACRYMQYGSNYSAEGTASVSAIFFNREDYEFGTARIPMVGDRIGIKSVAENGEWVVNQYELQKYIFNHDNYSVEMSFGMPILNLGEIIYNMMSNAGMSIIPADS